DVVWSFQTVHHDVWDYDLPAQPTLATLMRDGKPVDVVVQVTKTGFMFVLERDTGKPFFGVEERPVPQGAVAGEALSPTQPFPVKPPALVPQKLEKGGAWGVAWFDKRACNAKLDNIRNDGLFTPPSTQGTLLYPFTGGGANWGGMSFDPDRKIAIVNVNRAGHIVTLFPEAEFKARKEASPGKEISPQEGTPYGMERDLFMSPLGLPCSPPPWGTLVAVDLNDGTIKWNRPLGTIRDLAPIPLPLEWGVPNFGGPLTTKTGLVFIGATMDNYLRAFDIANGKELWKGRLPAGGQATPMSYTWKGRQYVVIAAGGHARAGTKIGDYVIAYALPEGR
ncbi:MAG TPA: pyrroloquinoline quinone-dependent dehydrogenase, partial [Parvibaculum sp.]|nr:pyrroloquinoline quinone-dependent dehydrogenase [Parvibaculum sp.]